MGIVPLMKIVSMIPLNRAMPKPGPHPSVSMRPGVGPRGVEKSTLARRKLSGPSKVIDSTSGTVAAPCTVRRWT